MQFLNSKGFDKIADILIKNGADLNAADLYGWSVLHWAAIQGN